MACVGVAENCLPKADGNFAIGHGTSRPDVTYPRSLCTSTLSGSFLSRIFGCWKLFLCHSLQFEHLLPPFCALQSFQLHIYCVIILFLSPRSHYTPFSFPFSFFHFGMDCSSSSSSINCKFFSYSLTLSIMNSYFKSQCLANLSVASFCLGCSMLDGTRQ